MPRNRQNEKQFSDDVVGTIDDFVSNISRSALSDEAFVPYTNMN